MAQTCRDLHSDPPPPRCASNSLLLRCHTPLVTFSLTPGLFLSFESTRKLIFYRLPGCWTTWFFTTLLSVPPFKMFTVNSCLVPIRVKRKRKSWFSGHGASLCLNKLVAFEERLKFNWRLILKHWILKITLKSKKCSVRNVRIFILKGFLWDLLVLTNIQIVFLLTFLFLSCKELLFKPILGDIKHSDAELETCLP